MADSRGARISEVFFIVVPFLLATLFGCGIYFFFFYTPTNVTVTLLSARGLDAAADEHTAVEFDVAIGFLHLDKDYAVAHDGGHVTISYSGVKLAEGPVPKFYVAGGPGYVEAARAVATAPPLSQMFRDYLQVSRQQQQQDGGQAGFEVHLSLFDIDIDTGDTKHSDNYCTAALPLQGKEAAAATICGEAG